MKFDAISSALADRKGAIVAARRPAESPMFYRLFRFVTAAVILGLASVHLRRSLREGLPRASSHAVGGQTSIPYGWVDFCNRHREGMHPRQAPAPRRAA